MYSTLTVASYTTLLADLVTFATANGWTVNTDQTEGLGRRVTLSKIAGMYIHLRSFSNENSILTNVASLNYTGIGVAVSRTNNTTSINSNVDYQNMNGCLAVNPSLPFTYHFMSTADGNSINVAVVTKMVNNPAIEAVLFLGFGTSINKTTTVNDTWYLYTPTAGNTGLMDTGASYSLLTSDRQSFIYTSNGQTYNYPAFGIYSTSPFYGGSSNLYSNQTASGLYGILSHAETKSVGVGVYDYLRLNSASTAFANTTLVPSNIFMKHVSSGFNLIGTVPLLWLHNSVTKLYKNGQIVVMDGKEYVMFAYHAYEVVR